MVLLQQMHYCTDIKNIEWREMYMNRKMGNEERKRKY